jgi:hypothetical protein
MQQQKRIELFNIGRREGLPDKMPVHTYILESGDGVNRFSHALFHIKYKTLEVTPFGVIDINGMIGAL